MTRILYNNNCERSELSGLFNGMDFFYIYIYIYNIYVTVHTKTLRKSAILISRYRSRRHERQFILFSVFSLTRCG